MEPPEELRGLGVGGAGLGEGLLGTLIQLELDGEIDATEREELDAASEADPEVLAELLELGAELARVRSGDEYPSEDEVQAAKRDVLARVIYGFRLSILFTLIVTGLSAVIGIFAGAIQGYFGGKTDLFFQRFIEIWVSTPSLYIIIIMFAILGRSFWLLVFLTALFGWPALVGVVRAEFLRARNLE